MLPLFLGCACGVFAQETDSIQVEQPVEVPEISYSLSPKKYKIADIKVSGIKNYDDFVLIGFSGLSVGDEVTIPGDEITTAVKRFWRHGLFSDVKILASKIEGDQVWLEIQLKQRPRSELLWCQERRARGFRDEVGLEERFPNHSELGG